MTTSNKNFKVKNGLEVLGTFATVDGNEILTSASVLDALANVDTTGITDGQTIIYDEATLTFVPGTATGGGASVVVSDTAPLDPELNTLWYHSNSGALFIRLGDVDSEQWVQIGMAGPQGIQGESGILAQATAPIDTTVLWLDTDEEGIGIPLGGTAGQVLSKIDSANFNTEWTTPLAQSDIDTALQDYYTSAQVDVTLQDYYTSTQVDTTLQDYYTATQIDTTFQDYYTTTQTDSVISTAVSNVIDTAPAMLDTLNELSTALNDDPNFATTVANALAALVPSGTINQTARATAPSGYLLCDGSAISRTTYSSLFDAIGTAYGAGDGSSTFNIPNLKGRVPVGYDPSQSEFDALGEIGGAKTHTLTIDQMPSHTHIQDAHGHSINDPGHSHVIRGPVWRESGYNVTMRTDGGAGQSVDQGARTNTDYTGVSVNSNTATNQNTGGGQAHNNLQPYVVLNYMIKI